MKVSNLILSNEKQTMFIGFICYIHPFHGTWINNVSTNLTSNNYLEQIYLHFERYTWAISIVFFIISENMTVYPTIASGKKSTG